MNRWACVTGASSGIGEQMVWELAKRGYHCLITARRLDRLEQLKDDVQKQTGVTVKVVWADLSQDESIKIITDAIASLPTKLSILVNNAGFGAYGPFIEGDIEQYTTMITVNITRLTQLTHHVVHHMTKPGTIIQVASLAGFLPGPTMAVYYATKAYVVSLAVALNQEFKKENITVSAFCPGPVATEFGLVAQAQNLQVFKRIKAQSSQSAAKMAIDQALKGKVIVLSSFAHRFILPLIQVIPLPALARITDKIQRKKALIKEVS